MDPPTAQILRWTSSNRNTGNPDLSQNLLAVRGLEKVTEWPETCAASFRLVDRLVSAVD